jgi:hypothetical protein
MGGYGSNRWGWCYRRKTTVEVCWSLDAVKLAREGFIKPGEGVIGSWGWWRNRDKSETPTARIGLLVRVSEMRGACRLSYTVTDRATGSKQGYNYVAPLEATPCNYGGVRWWFHCPECDRRVRKLYMPPDGRRFLCRHCHDLTYAKAQEHDKTMDKYLRMSWGQLAARLEIGDVRAACKILERAAREQWGLEK